MPTLTKTFPIKFALNLSSISFWFDKSKLVLTTFLAFDENHRVNTIIIPDKKRYRGLVLTFSDNETIENSDALIEDEDQDWNDSSAAIGTPIKLTRSFPANARAREKVPTPIIILYISSLKTVMTINEKIYQSIKLMIQKRKILESIYSLIVKSPKTEKVWDE